MRPPQLHNLAKELRSLGYSRSFIRQITDELEDHLECSIVEQGKRTPTQPVVNFDECIGNTETLLAAIQSRSDLDPLPRKYPAVFFLLLPGLCALLAATGVAYLADIYRHELKPDVNPLYVHALGCASYLVPVLLPLAGVLLSCRYCVPLIYQATLVFLTALSSLFVTGVAFCEQTNSTFVFSWWEFHPVRFVAPFAVTILSFGVVSLMSRQSSKRLFSIRANSVGHKQIALHLTAVCLMVWIYMSGTNFAAKQVTKHPIDNIANRFSCEAARARRYLNFVCLPEMKRELALSSSQIDQIRTLLNEHRDALAPTHDSSLSLDEREQNQEANDLRTTATFASLLDHLSDKQRNRFFEIHHQLVKWDALHLPEVRRAVGLDDYQYYLVKNLMVAKINERTTLLRKWRSAPKDQREAIECEIDEMNALFDQKFRSIFRERQATKWDSLLGAPFSSTSVN